ncbi:hypothetical protein ACW9HJ_22860 [Nocardia gipuzkoensis]
MSYLRKATPLLVAASIALVIASLGCVIAGGLLEEHYGGPDKCTIQIPLPPWLFVANWGVIVLAAGSVVCTVAALIGCRAPAIALLLIPALLLPGFFFLYIGVATHHDLNAPHYQHRSVDCRHPLRVG